eukprot:Nk52_evm2s495 gene=Nk52_evmTU2s495
MQQHIKFISLLITSKFVLPRQQSTTGEGEHKGEEEVVGLCAVLRETGRDVIVKRLKGLNQHDVVLVLDLIHSATESALNDATRSRNRNPKRNRSGESSGGLTSVLSKCVELKERCWEEFHYCHWKLVDVVWRDLYALLCVEEVLLRMFGTGYASGSMTAATSNSDTDPNTVRNLSLGMSFDVYLRCLKVLDLGIIMGNPRGMTVEEIVLLKGQRVARVGAVVEEEEEEEEVEKQYPASYCGEKEGQVYERIVSENEKGLSLIVHIAQLFHDEVVRLNQGDSSCSRQANESSRETLLSSKRRKLDVNEASKTELAPQFPNEAQFEHPIPRLHDTPSLQDFLCNYLNPSRPVIIEAGNFFRETWAAFEGVKGNRDNDSFGHCSFCLGDHIPSCGASSSEPKEGSKEDCFCKIKWASLQFWRNMAEYRNVPVERGRSYTSTGWTQEIMPFGIFLDNVCNQNGLSTDNSLLYLAQYSLFDHIPSLQRDIEAPYYCFLKRSEDPCEAGKEGECKDSGLRVNMWFGPGGTISPAHYDTPDNLLVQAVGCKYVRLFDEKSGSELKAKNRERKLKAESFSKAEMSSAQEVGSTMEMEGEEEDPLLHNTLDIEMEPNIFSGEEESSKDEFLKGMHFEECILKPGEMLFIPKRYWHYVRSLTPSISVSFWWNS